MLFAPRNTLFGRVAPITFGNVLQLEPEITTLTPSTPVASEHWRNLVRLVSIGAMSALTPFVYHPFLSDHGPSVT
jgi:hypothetical protein